MGKYALCPHLYGTSIYRFRLTVVLLDTVYMCFKLLLLPGCPSRGACADDSVVNSPQAIGKGEDFQPAATVLAVTNANWPITTARKRVVNATTAVGKAKNGHLTSTHVFSSSTTPTTGRATGKAEGCTYCRIRRVIPSATLVKVLLTLEKLAYVFVEDDAQLRRSVGGSPVDPRADCAVEIFVEVVHD